MHKKDNKCSERKIIVLRIREKEWNRNKKIELQKVIDQIEYIIESLKCA